MRRTERNQVGPCHLEDLEARALMSSSFNPDGAVVYGTGERVSSVVVADFNGDGRQDMVVAAGRSLQLLRGLGEGRFAAARTIATFNASVGLAVAGKFDTDTLPDLLVVQQTESPSGRGWMRVLLNLGNGNFFTSSYGRLEGLRVASLTAGNLDGDAQDEVVLIGDREIVEAQVNPANQELRVLDPRYTGSPTSLPFAAEVRMVQTTALRGSSIAAPTIVRNGNHGDVYIAMADGSADADGSVRVYSYEEFPPQIPEDPPQPPRLDLLSSTGITGRPTSMAAGRIVGDAALDVAVTTIGPDSGARAGGLVAMFGKTYVLRGLMPASGEPTTSFDAPVLVHSRVLGGEDPGLAGVRQYRIVKLSDLNSDGLMDIGLSVVESDGRGGATVQFVQLIQQAQLIPFGVDPTYPFTAFIGWWQRTAGVAVAGSSFGLTHVLADLRGTGRDDLVVLGPRAAEGSTGLRVVQNTVAFKRPRVVDGSITAVGPAAQPAPIGSRWDVHVVARTPEAVRFVQTAGVRVYRDSNRNGVLDAQDQLLGEATQDAMAAVVMDFDGSSHWTLRVTVGPSWQPGVQRLFAVARDSNGLSSAGTVVGTIVVG